MIDQGHLRNGEIEMQRHDTISAHRGAVGRALVNDTTKSWQALEKRCEDLKFLRCLTSPSLRHEKHRSFLFTRLDLRNRADPGEAIRNVEYMLQSASLPSSCDLGLPK
jgi:hypothetical protein